MSYLDPTQDAELSDDEAEIEDDQPETTVDDSRPPAASLTSIRLTRRRPSQEPRLVQRPPPPPSDSLEGGDAPSAAPPEPALAGPQEDDPPDPVAPEPAEAEPPSEFASGDSVARREDRPHRSSNIVDYWSRLRDGRAYPAPADLDSDLIIETWPNSVLLRHQAGESGMRAAALYKPVSVLDGAAWTMDFSPMVMEWMLSLAEQTVRSGQPMADKELFEKPNGNGPVRFAACALPLSEDQENVDHVLCYLRVLT